tara:strand:+ start:1123 stop:1458 length:336 start_codon:yes stop_codon:yes gene_type:complete
MNNQYQQLSDDKTCIICLEIVHSDKITNFCSNCNITMHYNCLYQWCVSSNDNKCPICLSPIEKIIDTIDNSNNEIIRLNRLNRLNNRVQFKVAFLGLSLFFIFIYFLHMYT